MKRKSRIKTTICRNSGEIARAMGLSPCHAIEWELRDNVTRRIIEVFQKRDQTVTRLAQKSRTSRARITRILKGDSFGISLDVLFRILSAIGQKITIIYRNAA